MTHDDRKRAIGKIVSVASDRFVIEMRKGTDNFTVAWLASMTFTMSLASVPTS